MNVINRERTFVMIKPDAVQRGLVGEIITRLERKGLKPVALRLMHISPELATRLYEEHRGKPFYDSLTAFITSGPVVTMVWEGEGAVDQVRRLMGETDPKEAAPGTIRGDLALYVGNNIVHGSDSAKSARREADIFFKTDDLCSYWLDLENWIYGS